MIDETEPGTAAAWRIERVGRLRRSVRDLARATAFYCEGLGFTVRHATANEALLGIGEESIRLVVVAERSNEPTLVVAPDRRFQHAAIVVSDIDAAWRRLQPFSPRSITHGGPVELPASSGGVTAWKLADPDGHGLELIHFPPGQGDPRWQDRSRISLGIDHYAVVVEALQPSLGFYVGRLGLRIESRGVNQGPTQAALDGLDDPVVDVVALTVAGATSTPHLELLAYRRPVPDAAASASHPAAPAHRGADRIELHTASGAAAEIADPDGHRYAILAPA